MHKQESRQVRQRRRGHQTLQETMETISPNTASKTTATITKAADRFASAESAPNNVENNKKIAKRCKPGTLQQSLRNNWRPESPRRYCATVEKIRDQVTLGKTMAMAARTDTQTAGRIERHAADQLLCDARRLNNNHGTAKTSLLYTQKCHGSPTMSPWTVEQSQRCLSNTR